MNTETCCCTEHISLQEVKQGDAPKGYLGSIVLQIHGCDREYYTHPPSPTWAEYTGDTKQADGNLIAGAILEIRYPKSEWVRYGIFDTIASAENIKLRLERNVYNPIVDTREMRIVPLTRQTQLAVPSTSPEVIKAQEVVYHVCLEKWGAENGVTIDALLVLDHLKTAPSTSPLTDQEINDVYFGATGQSLRPADMFLVRLFAHAVEARAKAIKGGE
jgi:hypothetical protein